MATEVVAPDMSAEADLREAITNLSLRAKREFPKVGNEKLRTPWDMRHDAINELLDLLDLYRA